MFTLEIVEIVRCSHTRFEGTGPLHGCGIFSFLGDLPRSGRSMSFAPRSHYLIPLGLGNLIAGLV